ncbi:unnamed protein product [Closterium sp. NIES-54]
MRKDRRAVALQILVILVVNVNQTLRERNINVTASNVTTLRSRAFSSVPLHAQNQISTPLCDARDPSHRYHCCHAHLPLIGRILLILRRDESADSRAFLFPPGFASSPHSIAAVPLVAALLQPSHHHHLCHAYHF